MCHEKESNNSSLSSFSKQLIIVSFVHGAGAARFRVGAMMRLAKKILSMFVRDMPHMRIGDPCFTSTRSFALCRRCVEKDRKDCRGGWLTVGTRG